MAYKQFLAGWVNKVLAVGRVAYGGDGTDLYPLNVDSTGQNVTLLASTASVGVIAAGSNRIGTVSGVLKEVRVTWSIDADEAYAANEVVAESETTDDDEPMTFDAVARANGGYGYIVGATVISETPSITPRLTIYLFNAVPTGCNLLDNVANTAPDWVDQAKYIGKLDFPAMESLGTSESNATIGPSTVGGCPHAFKCASADDAIYGVIVTRDAFTQGAGKDLTVILLVEQY